MLNEHLNVIHIIEQLNFSKLKSKIKQIGDAATSGNILRIKKTFDTVPDIPIEDLKIVARKKFASEYKKSEIRVSKHIKKSGGVFDALVLTMTSLVVIAKSAKDPDVVSKINDTVEELDILLKKVGPGMVGETIRIAITAAIIYFFIGKLFFIVPILVGVGVLHLAAAIFLYISKFFIDVFIQAKKAGGKVAV
jgi:hypothetical protein